MKHRNLRCISVWVGTGCIGTSSRYPTLLILAYRVLDGSAPTYLNALVRANVTPTTLRSSSEHRLALPSVQARQSRLFSFVVPRWWNELPSITTLQRAPPFLTGTLTSA